MTIPAGATAISLSFVALVVTDETYAYPYDAMTAYVSDVGGAAAATLVQLTNETVTPNWTRFTAELMSSYAGRTVEIGFFTATDDVLDTFFLVDTVTLNVTACASTGGTSFP